MKCGVVVLAVMALAHAAAASPIRLATSGDACSLDALEPQLAALVGSDPIDADATATARIDVTRDRGAFHAAITFDDGDGNVRGPRIVAAPTCGALVESVALVIAMALPDVRPAPSPPVATPPVATPPVAAPPAISMVQTSVTAVSADVPPQRPATLALIAGGAGGLTSHGMEGAVVIGARVRRGGASLGAEVRVDAPDHIDVGGMGRIDIARAQISVMPCVHANGVAGCLLASVGTFRGAGAGLDAARSVYTPLVAGGARVAWEHAFSARFALRAHLDLDVLATTTRFEVDHMPVWESPRFEAGTGIDIVALFP